MWFQGNYGVLRLTLLGGISFAGVATVISGEEVTEVEVVGGGRGVEKLKLGKADPPMGKEMAGRFGTSATLSQECKVFTKLH